MKSNFDRSKIGKMPPGYIPGISRGCHGFITRSDIGPMMADVTTLARDTLLAQQALRERQRDPDADTNNYNDINFDKWGGFQNVKLFTNHEYDEEDKEADETYATIDNHVGSKRGKQQEKQIEAANEALKKKNPPPKEFFKDDLKEISQMTRQDWMSIPEVKYKGKGKKEDKYTPVPDSLLSDRLKLNTLAGALDANIVPTRATGGVQSIIPGQLSALGDARRTILGLSLDKAPTSSVLRPALDKSGYMTQLGAVSKLSNIEIHDLKKARLLYKSMVDSDPTNAKAWQGAARIEELDGKLEAARNIIAQGVESCPNSEDVWAEAVRLEPHDGQQPLVTRAIKSCPKSPKLWLLAVSLEKDKDRKIKLIQKALQVLPQSEKLWRELIDNAPNDNEAKEWLQSAVECVPEVLDFRLALARLSSYEEAKEVINKANKYFKNEEMTVWIHASKLEEANGQPEKCEPIISRGVAKIAKKKQVFEREPWIDSAQDCDKVSSPETSKAIIKAIYMLDAQEHDGVSIWLDDISLAIQRGNAISARTMLEQAVTLAPNDKRLWEAYLEFEQRAGEGKYPKILERAAQISGLSGHAFLLRLGRELVRTGQVDKAKALLSEALKSSPKEESIWLANLEMLKQSGQQEECRKAIREAIATLPESTGLWRYSIKFERDMAHLPLALAEAEKAVAKFPLDIGIACDYGVILEELNRFDKARENYLSLTKTPKCQKDSRPWIHWMKLEEKLSGPAKARTVYESSKRYVHADPEMWISIIGIEKKAGNMTVLKSLLSEAVKECPKSGELWSLLVENEPRAARTRSTLNALEICAGDPYLMNVTARIFWLDLKKEKATSWFERCLLVKPTLGDTWAFYTLFCEMSNEEVQKKEVIRRCIKAEPNEGRIWSSIADKPSNWNKSTEQLLTLAVEEARKYFHSIK